MTSGKTSGLWLKGTSAAEEAAPESKPPKLSLRIKQKMGLLKNKVRAHGEKPGSSAGKTPVRDPTSPVRPEDPPRVLRKSTCTRSQSIVFCWRGALFHTSFISFIDALELNNPRTQHKHKHEHLIIMLLLLLLYF